MGGAGEIHPPYRRIGDQPGDDGRRIFWRVSDHVDHAVAEAGVLQHLTDQAVHRRAQLGRLEHQGITAGQRHRQRPGTENHRRVPGRDTQHHAAGLTQGHGEAAGHIGGDHLAINLRGHRRRLAQHAGGQVHVEAVPVGHRPGLAGQREEFRRAVCEHLGSLEQTRTALVGRQRGPGRKCRLRRGHGGIGIFQGSGGDPRHHFAGDRITTLEHAAIGSRSRLTANQQRHLEHGEFLLLCLFRIALGACKKSIAVARASPGVRGKARYAKVGGV